MPRFLELLQRELALLSPKDFLDPGIPVRDNETEVGEMTDEQARLYTLAQQYRREAGHKRVEFEYFGGQELQNIEKEMIRLQNYAEVLNALLWASVKNEFSLWDKPCVGVRQGLKVIWCEQLESPPGLIIGSFPFPFPPNPEKRDPK